MLKLWNKIDMMIWNYFVFKPIKLPRPLFANDGSVYLFMFVPGVWLLGGVYGLQSHKKGGTLGAHLSGIVASTGLICD